LRSPIRRRINPRARAIVGGAAQPGKALAAAAGTIKHLFCRAGEIEYLFWRSFLVCIGELNDRRRGDKIARR
jgi:hypothetical protein